MPTKRNKENSVAIPATSAAASAPARRKSTAAPRAKHGFNRPTAAPAAEIETVTEVAAVETSCGPAYNEVAALAYTYWVGRGCQGGSPEEDWLRAEQELSAKANA
jgi:hypothetical protein